MAVNLDDPPARSLQREISRGKGRAVDRHVASEDAIGGGLKSQAGNKASGGTDVVRRSFFEIGNRFWHVQLPASPPRRGAAYDPVLGRTEVAAELAIRAGRPTVSEKDALRRVAARHGACQESCTRHLAS
eukprot:7289001-Pyramimonas_sp.AAC.1